METLLENPEIFILDEAEMEAIAGGSHYEWIDGELVFVQD